MYDDIVHLNKSYSERIVKNKQIWKILNKDIQNNKDINTLSDIPSEYKSYKVIGENKFTNSTILFIQDIFNGFYFIIKSIPKSSTEKKNKNIHERINKIISSKENRNFTTTYIIIFLKNETLYIQEYYTYTLYRLLKNHNGFSTYKKINLLINFIKRILCSIITLIKNKIIHSDLHLNNIFINKSEDYTSDKYYNGIEIENNGYDIAISDFNESQTFEDYNINKFLLRFFSIDFLRNRKNKYNSVKYVVDIYIFTNSLLYTLSEVMNTNIRDIMIILNDYKYYLNETIRKVFVGGYISETKIINSIIDLIYLFDFEDNEKKIKSLRI